MTPRCLLALALVAALPSFVPSSSAQVAPGTTPKAPPGFEITRWAREPMLRSPVALSYDDQGRLYVVETARRSTVDIDIRAHPDWVIDDLANQSVDDLRAFFRRRMSPENSTLNASWLQDLNHDGSHDWRDLMEVREKVHRIEDSQGTGKADRAQVFAEGFNEEINGVIAGVLPWGDDVFVTVYPDLWRLRDNNGDGVADTKEIVFRGFGVHAAFDGHDLHGLIAGPDGKLYFSIGDNGFSVTNREGRLLHHPNTGGVLRMNPDGSDLEVFATGLRNPQEVAFDEFGNLFSVDNDGDLADERERFVFIAEGSDSGWRLHWQFREAGWAKHTRQPNYNPWIDERMWVPHFPGQPAHITPPLSNYSVGPGSFRYNPGTALGEAERGCFFLIQFPVAKVTAFQTRPKGAGFEMVNERTFVSGIMASAINFSPDGALAIGDWDGMWSPSGRGSIWRVDDPGAAGSAVRTEVRDALKAGTRKLSAEELIRRLGHADMRLRQGAQFELVRRGDFDALRRTALSSAAPVLARVHAIWGLGQGNAVRNEGDLPLDDTDPRIRAQAAKVAGDRRVGTAAPALIRHLKDPEAPVRFHAAIALGKIRNPAAIEGLVDLLASNADADAFLRHAAVMGLAGAASASTLGDLAHHPHAAVRLAAVIALRRLGAAEATRFLTDAEVTVRREAVRAIHDDRSIPEALPALARIAEQESWLSEPGMVRRILNANLRVGSDETARRLARIAGLAQLPEELRLEAVHCLAEWNQSPALDRVQGFVRPLGARDADLGHRMIREHFAAWTRNASPTLLPSLVRLVVESKVAVDPTELAEGGMSESQPASVRAQVLDLLAQRNSPRFADALRRSLDDAAPELRLTAMRLLAERQPDDFLRRADGGAESWSIRERQAALHLAASIKSDAARAWIERQWSALESGKLPVDLTLDVWESAAARPEAALRERVAAWESKALTSDPHARHRPTLAGGDPRRGEEIFRSHPNAQCVRCHDGGGEGKQVGPVLQGVAGRLTPEDLLIALIDPSARIADGYATTSITLRNGDDLDGVRIGETPETLTLRLPSGEVRSVPRRDITRQATSAVSSMPPMGEVLTRFELRDLLAYLRSLK